MAHRWGFNVTEAGLGDTGCSLAARDLFSGIVYYTNERLPFPFVRGWILQSVFTLNYVAFDLNVGANWYLPFPYGLLVVPDAPM